MLKKLKRITRKIGLWFDYNPPGSMSSKGWRLFDKEFRERAPIRYWITHEFKYSTVQPLKFKYRRISDWVRYRTTDRYHVVKTGLPPGYCDVDTKMLHTNFTMLKDFVECEQGWHKYCWHPDGHKSAPWYTKLPLYWRFVKFRSPKWGIEHLEWASTLDDPNLPVHERAVGQAEDAREILALYYWWVRDRPARTEIEYKEYSDQGLGILGSLDDDFDKDAPDYREYKESIAQSIDQEQAWYEEDTEMLIRLVRIRRGLWT